MFATGFFVLIIALFATLFVYEGGRGQQGAWAQSLPSWLVSGNWTAKAGAILMVLGVGSLIRYAVLHSILPPELKIGAGLGGAAVFGALSFLLRNNARQRALHLALGGAALAVAYLTTYSAYGFFELLPEQTGIPLLIVVSIIGTLVALRTHALSIAILSMIGAYAAPCFSVTEPGIALLYSYYFVLSLLCLMMVWQKGWRALTHLSFLFTLGGSVFFGWTYKYYTAQYFDAIFPVLLGMTALHLAMSIAEQAMRHELAFDRVYTWILGLTAMALACLIVPNFAIQGPMVFGLFAGLWLAGAIAARLLRQPGELHYILIAMLFGVLALYNLVPQLPWLVIAIAAGTALLVFAPRLRLTTGTQNDISTAIMIGAVVYLLLWTTGPQSILYLPAYKIAIAACLLLCAYVCKMRGLTLEPAFAWIGAVWSGYIVLSEVVVHLNEMQMTLFIAVIGALLIYAGHRKASRRIWRIGSVVMAVAAVKLIFFDFDLNEIASIITLIVAGGVFLLISWLVPYPPEQLSDQSSDKIGKEI